MKWRETWQGYARSGLGGKLSRFDLFGMKANNRDEPAVYFSHHRSVSRKIFIWIPALAI
jgi:hypothetical protein